MPKEKLPRYRVLYSSTDSHIEDEINKLAELGYSVVHFKSNGPITYRDGDGDDQVMHPGEVVLMELLRKRAR
jgi:hypothetical protein